MRTSSDRIVGTGWLSFVLLHPFILRPSSYFIPSSLHLTFLIYSLYPSASYLSINCYIQMETGISRMYEGLFISGSIYLSDYPSAIDFQLLKCTPPNIQPSTSQQSSQWPNNSKLTTRRPSSPNTSPSRPSTPQTTTSRLYLTPLLTSLSESTRPGTC